MILNIKENSIMKYKWSTIKYLITNSGLIIEFAIIGLSNDIIEIY